MKLQGAKGSFCEFAGQVHCPNTFDSCLVNTGGTPITQEAMEHRQEEGSRDTQYQRANSASSANSLAPCTVASTQRLPGIVECWKGRSWTPLRPEVYWNCAVVAAAAKLESSCQHALSKNHGMKWGLVMPCEMCQEVAELGAHRPRCRAGPARCSFSTAKRE